MPKAGRSPLSQKKNRQLLQDRLGDKRPVEEFLNSLDADQQTRLEIALPLIENKLFTIDQAIKCHGLRPDHDLHKLKKAPQLMLEAVTRLEENRFLDLNGWLRPRPKEGPVLFNLLQAGELTLEELAQIAQPNAFGILKRQAHLECLRHLGFTVRDLLTWGRYQFAHANTALNRKEIRESILNGEITSLEEISHDLIRFYQANENRNAYSAVPSSAATSQSGKSTSLPAVALALSGQKMKLLKELLDSPLIDQALTANLIRQDQLYELTESRMILLQRFIRAGKDYSVLTQGGYRLYGSLLRYLDKQDITVSQVFDLFQNNPQRFELITQMLEVKSELQLGELFEQNQSQLEILLEAKSHSHDKSQSLADYMLFFNGNNRRKRPREDMPPAEAPVSKFPRFHY